MAEADGGVSRVDPDADAVVLASESDGVGRRGENGHAGSGGGTVSRTHRGADGGQDFQKKVQERAGGAVVVQEKSNGSVGGRGEIGNLEELLSKLNPMAKEFVPPSRGYVQGAGVYGNGKGFVQQQHWVGNENGDGNGIANGISGRRRNNYNQGRRRMNNRTSMAQREERIRRTVYVSDVDLQVTEEQLAALFVNCGQVNDCRICGDPNSVLRFAFIEFSDEESARAALNLAGTVLGYYPVRVLPSKTAIAPVNPTFLPRSEDEREMCTRTIYCTNIDKKINQTDLKLFFESICGEIYRLRLLGDYQHSTRIAFVEFVSTYLFPI